MIVKVRDVRELQAALDGDFGWRVQEMTNIKQLVLRSRNHSISSAHRASVPLLYAHYEGFFKNSAIAYAAFISSLGLRFCDLKDCLQGVRAMQKIKQINDISRRFSAAGALFREIGAIPSEKAIVPLHEYIQEVGNLDPVVLEQILDLLNINSSFYLSRRAFIQEILIRNRNGIAHGERYPVDESTFNTIYDGVGLLIRSFKSDIENAVTLKTYLC